MAKIICENCNTESVKGKKFCPECGFRFKDKAPSEIPSVLPPKEEDPKSDEDEDEDDEEELSAKKFYRTLKTINKKIDGIETRFTEADKRAQQRRDKENGREKPVAKRRSILDFF
jgi:hypothetical protein